MSSFPPLPPICLFNKKDNKFFKYRGTKIYSKQQLENNEHWARLKCCLPISSCCLITVWAVSKAATKLWGFHRFVGPAKTNSSLPQNCAFNRKNSLARKLYSADTQIAFFLTEQKRNIECQSSCLHMLNYFSIFRNVVITAFGCQYVHLNITKNQWSN